MNRSKPKKINKSIKIKIKKYWIKMVNKMVKIIKTNSKKHIKKVQIYQISLQVKIIIISIMEIFYNLNINQHLTETGNR